MQRFWHRLAEFIAVMATVFAPAINLAADEAQETAEGRGATLAQMKRIADTIHIYTTPDRKQSEVQRIGDPVLRYTDDTRQLSDSTIWIWGQTGRPAAVVAIEYYPKKNRAPSWLCEVVSVSGERISVERGADINWTARQPGASFTPLKDAPQPAESSAARLAQMKQLQRRFTAHERAIVGGRIELRPLAKPLHRYQDPAAGVQDGAIFSFANGTNPEVLLILEAYSRPGSDSDWAYALAQATGAAVEVELEGKPIWNRDHADPPSARDAYVNSWLTVDPPK